MNAVWTTFGCWTAADTASACAGDPPGVLPPLPKLELATPVGLVLPGGPMVAVPTGVMSIGSSEADGDSEGVADSV